jgi:hypothetical protein
VLSLFTILVSVPAQSAEPQILCGQQCEAQVLERGTRKPLAGIALRIGDEVVESNAEGGLVFGDQGLKSLGVVSLDPAWETREAQLDTALGSDRFVWLEANVQEALGTYHRETFPGSRLNKGQIAAQPGSLQDPLRALQSLAGTTRAPMNSGWLLVRGVNPQDSRFFWAGLPLAQLVHLGGFASVFHPETIHSVTFQPTGWVNRTAGLGGQVEVEGAPPSEEGRIHLGADLINASAFATSPLGKGWGATASVRNSWLRSAMRLANGEEASRIAPNFRDWSAGLQGRNQSVLYLGFTDEIDAPTADGEQILQIEQSVHQVLAQRTWSWGSQKLLWSAQLASQAQRLFQESERMIARENQQARSHVEWHHENQQVQTTLGADFGLGAQAIRFNPQQIQRTWGSAEGFWSIQIGRKRALDLGVRNTHLTMEQQPTRFALNPAARLNWPLFQIAKQSVAFQSRISRRHQAPDKALLVGDPEGPSLNLERADAVSAGLFFDGLDTKNRPLRLSVEAFSKALSHLSLREEDGTLGQFSGKAQGIEAFGQWEGEALTLGLSASFSTSTRQEDADHESLPHALDPGIQWVSIAIWQGPADWTLSTRFRYASGVPFQSDRPTAYDLFAQQEVWLKPTVNESTGRLPDPHSLDLKISKRRTYKRWRLEAYLDLQNIYNRRVPEPILTGFEEKPVFGFGMPFLPVFGVEGQFWP